MRLIDADDLRELLDGGYDIDLDELPETKAELLRMIDYQETVDAEPVRHGHWLPYEYGDETWHKCSECGTADKYGYKYTAFDGNEHIVLSVRNFCPNCGAKMDEEAQNETD